jgi:hypothetical protein
MELATTPTSLLPGPRPAPDEVAAAMGPMPWLTATGRLDQVLNAWSRGHLAEVPCGVSFDVLLTPVTLGRDAVHRMHEAGRRVGPVVLGPLGAEFIVERGSAAGWSASHSVLLREGALVLLPPPGDESHVVAARSWLVPPCHPATGAPLCADVTSAGALLEPFQAAVQAAAARKEWPCAR